MPATGSYNNTSALFRAIVPQQSFAQLSAMRDRELQLAAMSEERARVSQVENQQAIQAQQDFLAQIQNQPFEAPDKQRIKLYMKERQAELANHIKERYTGNEGKFFKAESQAWMKNVFTDLTNSDLWAAATSNRENVAFARDAMKKQDYLAGTFNEDGSYTSAEQSLLDFMNGKNPRYTFNGSYKPDNQKVYDHFSKMDNPYGSKFDQSAYASPEDIQNVLTGTVGRFAKDLYYRDFQGKSVPFKRYSLEDEQLFGLDVANKQSMIASRANQNALGWARLDLARQKQADDKKDTAEYEQNASVILSTTLGATPYQPISKPVSQKLNTIGKPLSALMSPGMSESARDFAKLSGLPMQQTPGLEFQEISGVTAGPFHDRFSNLGGKGAKIKEGILADGSVLDMTKIPHKVISRNPNIFIDQNEYNRITIEKTKQGRTVYPDHEFRKVTVRIDKDIAERNGIDLTGAVPFKEPNPDKKLKDDPANDIITAYDIDQLVPTKGFFKSKEIQNLLNKKGFGQKIATELLTQPDEFQSPFDND